jgi:hypothetical protein
MLHPLVCRAVVPNAVPAGAMAPAKAFLGAHVFTERGYNEKLRP